MKSKKLLLMLLLACGMAFASESNFVQFTRDDFNLYFPNGDWREGTSQFWEPAQIITLNVSAGSSVYISNYVKNFNLDGNTFIENLGDSYTEGFDMTAGAYGYMIAQKTANGKVTTDGVFHPGIGDTKDITYYDPANSSNTQTTKGYLLDTFTDDTEILFIMSPNGYNNKKVDSYYPVNDPDFGYNTILDSRQINTKDIAGNVRVNFGTLDGVGHEFVLGYTAAPPSSSGQPLPGVLSTIVVACCSIACAKKMKKNK